MVGWLCSLQKVPKTSSSSPSSSFISVSDVSPDGRLLSVTRRDGESAALLRLDADHRLDAESGRPLDMNDLPVRMHVCDVCVCMRLDAESGRPLDMNDLPGCGCG